MDNLLLLTKAYRQFLLELGAEFKKVKDDNGYSGFADTFVDVVKSPEIGFSVAEASALMKMHDMFCLLEPEDLPSHHLMKLMVNKSVDMDLLEAAQTLSVTDFKELIKDKEIGTQERTYRYEIIKRSIETGSIKRVYDEEIEVALKELNVNK